MKKRWVSFLGVCFGVVAISIACAHWTVAPNDSAERSTSVNDLLVAAAASLQNVMNAVTALPDAPNAIGASVTYSFGASGALQRQIEQGAPVDVFISAAVEQMDALERNQRLLPGTRRNLLANRLALVVPKGRAPIQSFEALTRPDIGRIAIGEPRSVPAGAYGVEVLTHLGLLEQVQPKFTYGNNVTTVLAAVESGEADAGIVYLTDAKSSESVTLAAIANPSWHSPIVYPAAVLADSPNPETAQRYLDWLQGDTATAVFRAYGFDLPA